MTVEDPWLPIETAPKDRRILLFWPTRQGGRIAFGRWNPDPRPLGRRHAVGSRPYWSEENARHCAMELRARHPTHWQPEPPRPATPEGHRHEP